MSDWDQWEDEWDEPARTPSRAWVVVVAVVLLVPFVAAFAGVGTMLRTGGAAVVAILLVCAVLAPSYVIVVRWLRRQERGGAP